MSPTAKLPTAVIVGAVTYTVTADPADWVVLGRADLLGHCDHNLALILLNPTSAPDVLRLTLWHEVLHAAINAAAGSPPWKHLGGSKEHREETVVRRLESPTLMVLRDNPDLAAYLVAS